MKVINHTMPPTLEKKENDDANSSTASNENSFSEGLLKNLKLFAHMQEFNPKVVEWVEWKERLEVHFMEIACEDENAKAATLLRALANEPYSLLRALCDPDLPSKKTYEELCTILDRHFLPPVIIYRERLHFYSATKSPTETVTAWYARVKKLAVKCKFNPLEEFLRDRFVIGMAAEEKIFEKLCEQDQKLTLAEAYSKALICETI